MRKPAFLAAMLCLAFAAEAHEGNGMKIVIYGATGTMGSAFVEEALLRGYEVTGVSRDVSRFDHIKWPGFTGVQGDITDIDSVRRIVSDADIVLVSVMGSPTDTQAPRPEDSVQYVAALNLIAVSRERGDTAPRIIQVNGGSTLYYNGEYFFHHLPPGVAPAEGTIGYSIMWGHHLVLETYREASDVNWTVATPQPGTEFGERGARTQRSVTVSDGRFEKSAEDLQLTEGAVFMDWMRNLGEISAVDFGVAIFDEIENEEYLRDRFTAFYTD